MVHTESEDALHEKRIYLVDELLETGSHINFFVWESAVA